MTSAPKSDKITAALGPAMKLARSTTFSSEKMLSLAIGSLLNRHVRWCCSPPAELRRAFFKEGGRALTLVLGRRAQTEVGSLEQEAYTLACLHAHVGRVERELDGHGSVGSDLPQDGLGA